jgi:hypothetical protein
MDIYYNIDYSLIDRLELKKINVTFEEIQSVFFSPNSHLKPYTGFDYLIGYSNRRKFIHVAYKVSPDPNYELQALQIDLPYEEDIKDHWCKG